VNGDGLRRGPALALVVLASALPHAGALLGRASYYFRDFSVTFYPLRLFQARELAALRWPSWNPYVHEGSFALPILYPPDLLHALWPGPAAVSWLLTLHYPLAALGAWYLARELGASRAGAVVSGAAYSLGGLALSSLNLYVFLQALALAPAAVALLRRAARDGGRWVPAAALLTALSLTTLAVEFVAQALALGLLLGWAARPAPRALFRGLAATALGLGLAAVPVAVISALTPETVRGAGFEGDVAMGNALHPVGLLQVLVPSLFGSLSAPVEEWWGGHFFTKGFPYFLSIYLGGIVLALAAAAWPEIEKRTRLVLAGAALLALWYALGATGGLAPLLSHLPAFRVLRYPSKALFTPCLGACMAAGLGWDRLRRGRGWGVLAATLAAAGALALVPALALAVARAAVSAWAELPPGAASRLIAASATAALVPAAACVLAVLAWRGRLRQAAVAALLAALAVLDLAWNARGMNPQVSPRFFEPLPEMAALGLDRKGRVFSYGVDESPAFRLFLASGVRGLGLWSFFVNRQAYGGYNNVIDRVETSEGKDITSFVLRSPGLRLEDYQPARVGSLLPWLRNAAVTHVVSVDALSHAELALVQRVDTGQPLLPLHVYRVAGPWPRAYVACRALVAASRQQAGDTPLRGGFDPGRDVALEQAPPAAGAPCASGTVRPLARTPAEETYAVELDGAGLLVTRDSHARGWRATVDGQPVDLLRANGHQRAVPLGPGAHQVTLRYVPPGLRAGVIVTAVAAAVALGLAVRPGGASA
jgi:hypothetical protein